jgi:hypothetical protein
VLAGLALILAAAPIPATWVEGLYSGILYLRLQHILTAASNLTRVAWLDGLAFAGLAALTWRLAVLFRRRHSLGARRVAAIFLGELLSLVALAYVLFVAAWGLNYRRQPLRDKLDFDARRFSNEALVRTAREAVVEVNRLYRGVENASWPALEDLPAVLGPAFESAQRSLPAGGPAVPGRPKISLLTLYFRRAAIDGMTNPFALEIIVNDDVLPFERPFVVAHEWAHLAGYANESEANFVGWLTCLRGDGRSRYSGWLFLSQTLIRQVGEPVRSELLDGLDPGPRADLRAVAERLRQARPAVQRAAARVYDRFLKANRVTSGVASYDEVAMLIVGTRFGPDWRPLPRPRSGS